MAFSGEDGFDIAKWIGGLLVGIAWAVYRAFGGGEKRRMREAFEEFKEGFKSMREDISETRKDMRQVRDEVENLRRRIDTHVEHDEEFEREVRRQYFYRGNGR